MPSAQKAVATARPLTIMLVASSLPKTRGILLDPYVQQHRRDEGVCMRV